MAATLIGDRDLTRDVVQESMMRAYVAWEQVSGLERPGAVGPAGADQSVH